MTLLFTQLLPNVCAGRPCDDKLKMANLTPPNYANSLKMRNQEDIVLKYINDKNFVTLHLETIAELKLNKFEANNLLFNLLQYDFIAIKNGKAEITAKGKDYLKTVK